MKKCSVNPVALSLSLSLVPFWSLSFFFSSCLHYLICFITFLVSHIFFYPSLLLISLRLDSNGDCLASASPAKGNWAIRWRILVRRATVAAAQQHRYRTTTPAVAATVNRLSESRTATKSSRWVLFLLSLTARASALLVFLSVSQISYPVLYIQFGWAKTDFPLSFPRLCLTCRHFVVATTGAQRVED